MTLEVKYQASTPWVSDTSLKIQSPSPKSKHSQSCRNDRKLVITCELWSAKCAKCDAVSPVSLEMSRLLTSSFAHQISQEWVEMGENKRYLQSSGKFLLLKMQPSIVVGDSQSDSIQCFNSIVRESLILVEKGKGPKIAQKVSKVDQKGGFSSKMANIDSKYD